MNTALDFDVSILKKNRCTRGKEAVNVVKIYAFQQSKCDMVHTRDGMFRKLVCSSADTGCTWFVNLSHTKKGGVGDWHMTRSRLSHGLAVLE